ncbi:hypothetical protein BKA80DRAFT_275347 [Phyllosticta citrichinensis]
MWEKEQQPAPSPRSLPHRPTPAPTKRPINDPAIRPCIQPTSSYSNQQPDQTRPNQTSSGERGHINHQAKARDKGNQGHIQWRGRGEGGGGGTLEREQAGSRKQEENPYNALV